MSPTLSACLMTGGPGPRVAALLRLLRPVAGELIVALDDRADPETEAAISAVADTVIRYHYREPVDRPLRWLFSLCKNDWILNVDDDEIPSTGLLAELPELIAATDVTHYWLLRKWLWPGPETMIAEQPWTTDYQLRLVPNEPLLLRFPSETHRPLAALGPHRYVRAPLYHADTALSSLERREAKARKYEALRPGKRVGGAAVNTFFLPERREGLRTQLLPTEDLELVRAVLEATPEGFVPAAPARLADNEEIDALWSVSTLGSEDRKARVGWLDQPTTLTSGEQVTFDVAVVNLGGVTWAWGVDGEPVVRVSYQWLDANGDLLEDGLWTAFSADLPPGGAQLVPLHVLAPAVPGRYRLRLDLIDEQAGWFGCGKECEVDVAARRRLALIGDPDAVARAVAELAAEAPEVEPIVLSGGPPPRFGPPQAPDAREYLLAGTTPGSWRDLRTIAQRSTALQRAARAISKGTLARPLPRDAQPFLEALSGCTELVFVAGAPAIGTRELWVQRATVTAARELGVAVSAQRGAVAEASGVHDRFLLRKLLRDVRLVEPNDFRPR